MAVVLEIPAKRLLDAYKRTMLEKDVLTIESKNPLLQAAESGVPIRSQSTKVPFGEETTAETVAPAGEP